MLLKLLFVSGVALVGGVFCLIRWRAVMLAVMVLLVYEGALRKWVLPGFQAQLFALKDLILFAAFAGFLYVNHRVLVKFPVGSAVRFFMICCSFYFAAMIFNPNSPSLLLGILGFKNYVFYFGVAIIVPYIVTEQFDLSDNLRKYMLIVMPAILISYLQFFLPPTHWLNAYVQQSSVIESITSQFGGDFVRARTAGTFSFLSGNVTFLTAMFVLALSLLVSRDFKFKDNKVVYFTLASSMGAMFTTGSRFGVLSLATAVLFILGIAVRRGFIPLAVFFKACLSLCIAVGGIVLFVPGTINAFIGRATRVTDLGGRFLSPIFETVSAYVGSPFIGTGLATTHGGLVPLVLGSNPGWDWLNGTHVEIEAARVMQETGAVGFVLFYGLRVSAAILALRLALSFKSRLYSALASGIAFWFLIHMVLYIAGNPSAALFFYFGLGLLVSMWRLEAGIPLPSPTGRLKVVTGKINRLQEIN